MNVKVLSERAGVRVLSIFFALATLPALMFSGAAAFGGNAISFANTLILGLIYWSPILCIVAAVGLWRFRRWGRWIAMGISLLMFYPILSLLSGSRALHKPINTASDFWWACESSSLTGLLALPFAFTLYYLSRPSVRNVFESTLKEE